MHHANVAAGFYYVLFFFFLYTSDGYEDVGVLFFTFHTYSRRWLSQSSGLEHDESQ